MLFWLFVIVLIIGIVCVALEELFEWIDMVGGIIITIASVAILASGIIMIDTYGNVEANIAENNQTYESLTYQLENNLYDNDNDVGKKELYSEIQEWNEDLAYYQNIQDNFWFGIYYPNIYNQFEFIDYQQETTNANDNM